MARTIALIAGDSGSGKTFFVANLKDALIYDTDIGGGAAYLDGRIERNGSLRVEVGSFKDLLDDLARRQKDGTLKKFRTLVVDHLTVLHQESRLRWNPNIKDDFGRSGDKASFEWRALREFCRDADFNLFCTSHLKDVWNDDVKVGMTPDGAKNLSADFHIVIFLSKAGAYPATAHVRKWRRDPDDPRGAVPDTFKATVAEFERINGDAGDPAARAPKREQVPTIKDEPAPAQIQIGMPAPAPEPEQNTPGAVRAALGQIMKKTGQPAQTLIERYLKPHGASKTDDLKPEHIPLVLEAIRKDIGK